MSVPPTTTAPLGTYAPPAVSAAAEPRYRGQTPEGRLYARIRGTRDAGLPEAALGPEDVAAVAALVANGSVVRVERDDGPAYVTVQPMPPCGGDFV